MYIITLFYIFILTYYSIFLSKLFALHLDALTVLHMCHIYNRPFTVNSQEGLCVL